MNQKRFDSCTLLHERNLFCGLSGSVTPQAFMAEERACPDLARIIEKTKNTAVEIVSTAV